MLRFFIFAACALCVFANQAIVVLQGSTTVKGTITFTEANGVVTLEGEISGLKEGRHGFHVHSRGDLSDGCTSTGSHFNPQNKTHGGPTASVRHVGDLGNVEADSTGVAKVNISDNIISLTGANGILGRAIVVHEDEDDLGLGGHALSSTTGNAGARLACGIIGILGDDFDFGGASGFTPPSSVMIISLLLGTLFLKKLW